MDKARVFFTKELTPEAVVELYKRLGVELPGKVAVKVHSGEDGNQNYLRPEFMRPMIEYVGGTVVECNTAYGGARNTTPKHIELMKKHGWFECFDVDIMDSEAPDVVWQIPNGKVIKENHLGRHIEDYASMLVLSHFKGHPMGGYGAAVAVDGEIAHYINIGNLTLEMLGDARSGVRHSLKEMILLADIAPQTLLLKLPAA